MPPRHPPLPRSAPQSSPADGPAPPPNLLFGVLRRWPWLLLGLSAGLVLGLLYHMQSAPVYQSTAQLLVIKNRPEITSTGASDARVQFVEDYVATQVLYLKSERILERTAKNISTSTSRSRLSRPASEGERVGFLIEAVRGRSARKNPARTR